MPESPEPDNIPPEIPGRERYWRTHRNKIHRGTCGYIKDQRVLEWTAERGRSWEEIDREAGRKGQILWWCFKCFPQAHPARRMGELKYRRGKKIFYRPA